MAIVLLGVALLVMDWRLPRGIGIRDVDMDGLLLVGLERGGQEPRERDQEDEGAGDEHADGLAAQRAGQDADGGDAHEDGARGEAAQEDVHMRRRQAVDRRAPEGREGNQEAIEFARKVEHPVAAGAALTGVGPEVRVIADIPTDRPAYMHSFALTERFEVEAVPVEQGRELVSQCPVADLGGVHSVDGPELAVVDAGVAQFVEGGTDITFGDRARAILITANDC